MIFGQESEILEFKKSTGELNASMHDISAILNKHGAGELYFGIHPNGTVLGQTVTEKSLRDVSQAIKNFIEPRIFPTINKVRIDGKNCIRVIFSGNEPPYFGNGRAYKRVSDESLVMTSKELEDYFIKKQTASPWDSEGSGRTIDDINTNKLRSYMKKAREAGRVSFAFTDREGTLTRLKVLENGTPMNAAEVMFGKSPNLELQAAIFATEEKNTFLDIQAFTGTIPELIDSAEQYLITHMRWRVEFDGSMERKEIPEVPLPAIREALQNSFCHHFSSRKTIQFLCLATE
jgi:ATP-dependent DNA helicase RecG